MLTHPKNRCCRFRKPLAALVLCGVVASISGRSAESKTPWVTTGSAVRLAASHTLSLDGTWWLAADPKNVGREQGWGSKMPAEVKETKVPWIIQDPLVGYHGVAWYWRQFTVPVNPHAGGRYLLRFWTVDYTAEVWVNGLKVGAHEGGEDPFVIDITDAVKGAATNFLAVRVLNPTNDRIDGIVLGETPRRNKTAPYTPGSDFNYGGITDSVELLAVPPVRVDDLFVRPDPKTGLIRIATNIRNATEQTVHARLSFTVAPASDGEVLAVAAMDCDLLPGDQLVASQLRIENARLWDLNDPYLYRVTARVCPDKSDSFDEQSARCGFRDFRFTNGCFRLNGRRVFLRSSHTGADTPIGVRVPYDPDLLRRDLLNVKVMGFNMLRFIAGVPRRMQLDLADDIGLMIYEENFASWGLGNSDKMAERFDHSTAGMIRRDRNHPSIVMWGLLNETSTGPVFLHAVSALPMVRTLDNTRVVMLNSGRFDDFAKSETRTKPAAWRPRSLPVPNITQNRRTTPITFDGSTWPAGDFALHPGLSGEYSIVRWIAPSASEYSLSATFTGLAAKPTTSDIHIFHNGKPIFEDFINLNGKGNRASCARNLSLKEGDQIDVVVGQGEGNPYSDTTALAMVIKSSQGATYDVAADFSLERNPIGVWTYGYLKPGAQPDTATFVRYTDTDADTNNALQTTKAIGSLSNPGSSEWEDVLSDQHPYQRVPHTAAIIDRLRTINGGKQKVFMSEYGVGSAIDLPRLARHYEQLGKTDCEDAQVYRRFLDAFTKDWERWKLADTFASPEDYFRQCLAKMAGQRLLGINAIRANPNLIGYSLTGTMDQGLTAEGLTTTFRELKPGTVDALFEVFYPLRWCLFVEPVNAYRKVPARLEAVLANEDALPPGEYPVRLQVVGPKGVRCFDRHISVTIAKPQLGSEPAFALPVFSENVVIDGPSGQYRFLASFERGGAATGGEVPFYLSDPADMPAVPGEVLLWGEDSELLAWLKVHNISARPGNEAAQAEREVLLISGKPAAGGADAWRDLARRIARGSTAVFLSPGVFQRTNNPVGWLPLVNKGKLSNLASWVYIKDEWIKHHPIFDGLPCGGLMDYTFYRDIIPDSVWSAQDAPAEVVAGAINTSLGYTSGLMMSVHELGAGRFVLNTLRIRETLGQDPVAERLLLNLLRFARQDQSKPLAELPSNFDEKLRALAY